jgi:hypothetical protein
MYSFGNRNDFAVVDEPLYAHYLSNHQVDHPGREEILSSMRTDLAAILEEVIFCYYPVPYLFIKNMAHHHIDLDNSILDELDNVFLIRDLSKLILSFSKVIKNPTLQDIGIKEEYLLCKYLEERSQKFCVLDSDVLLSDPERILRKLCTQLQIPFDNNMLEWPAQARPEDGVWAKYWYDNVHKSSCFKKVPQTQSQLPDRLLPLYEEAQPYYEKLKEQCIQ